MYGITILAPFIEWVSVQSIILDLFKSDRDVNFRLRCMALIWKEKLIYMIKLSKQHMVIMTIGVNL